MKQKSHWDGAGVHPSLCRTQGQIGYSNQELFSQGGASLVPAPFPVPMLNFEGAKNKTTTQEDGPSFSLTAGGRGHVVAAPTFPVPMLNFMGGKNMSLAQADGPAYTIGHGSGHDMHVIAVPPEPQTTGSHWDNPANPHPTLMAHHRPGQNGQDLFCARGANLVNGTHMLTETISVGGDVAHTLTRRMDGSEDGTGRGTPLVACATGNVTHALTRSPGCTEDGTGRGTPLVPEAVPVQDGRGLQKAQNGSGFGRPGDPAYTLDTLGHQAVAFTAGNLARGAGAGPSETTVGTLTAQHGRGVSDQQPLIAFVQNQREELRILGEQAAALSAGGGMHQTNYIAQPPEAKVLEAQDDANERRVVGPLCCNTGPNGNDGGNFASNQAVDAGYVQPVKAAPATMAVRRLTPVECERLQGFPDNWTAIPWKNKPADQTPDGPRYKAMGNSMAVPVMRFIGQRIAMVDAKLKGAK